MESLYTWLVSTTSVQPSAPLYNACLGQKVRQKVHQINDGCITAHSPFGLRQQAVTDPSAATDPDPSAACRSPNPLCFDPKGQGLTEGGLVFTLGGKVHVLLLGLNALAR